MRFFVVFSFFFFFLFFSVVVVVFGSVYVAECEVKSKKGRRRGRWKMLDERADKRDREQLNRVHRTSNPFDKSFHNKFFRMTFRWRSHRTFREPVQMNSTLFSVFFWRLLWYFSTLERKLFLWFDNNSTALNVDHFDWIFCIQRSHLNILFMCFDFMRKQSVAIDVATSILCHCSSFCCCCANCQRHESVNLYVRFLHICWDNRQFTQNTKYASSP